MVFQNGALYQTNFIKFGSPKRDTPLTYKIILLLLRKDKKKMAIYHFSVKAISRADGRSAIAAAAYRSGEKLIDQKQQQEQDYTRKTGVEFKNLCS